MLIIFEFVVVLGDVIMFLVFIWVVFWGYVGDVELVCVLVVLGSWVYGRLCWVGFLFMCY